MNETVKMTWLRIVLRVLSVGFLAAFIPWITLILMKAPVLSPGSAFAPLLRFRPYNPAYESMMTSVYLVMAIMLWRASYNPVKSRLFIDFVIWANVAHGIVMLVATPMQKGVVMTFIEGVPLFAISAVLWWLRPSDEDKAVMSHSSEAATAPAGG